MLRAGLWVGQGRRLLICVVSLSSGPSCHQVRQASAEKANQLVSDLAYTPYRACSAPFLYHSLRD